MRLEQKHRTAIMLLVTGLNTNEVAKRIGVSSQSVSNWKNDFDFNDALQQAFSFAYDDAINKLASISLRAVDELERIICDCETPMRFKLQAISLILIHGEKAKNYQTERRLNKLEELTFNVVNDAEIISNTVE